ncbi:hypothetical protein C8J56DRAFT_1024952 [Mycena floridula]|nr:hypothetical protein C8J56DRAFT_1024952 [Mycena floridula]
MDLPVRYFGGLPRQHSRHPYLLVRLALSLDGHGTRGSGLVLKSIYSLWLCVRFPPTIKETWTLLFPQGSALLRRYLNDLAIETNHIEGIFLLTVEATKDLIRRGIDEGAVQTLPKSRRHDKNAIKQILNDTLGVHCNVIS